MLTTRVVVVIVVVYEQYASGGDLFNVVQEAKGHKLSESTARYFFQQLVSGLGILNNVFET
jgi:serine/threonine protein kinase